MLIRITEKTDVEDKGKYKQATVKYSQDGEDKEKKIMSFAQKETYNTLVNANPGEVYEVKTVKDGKFWNWEKATLQGAGTSSDSGISTSKKSTGGGTWETAEERALRQVWIIRQSSISSAATLLQGKGTVNDVLEAAKRFEAYVHGVEEVFDDSEPEIV